MIKKLSRQFVIILILSLLIELCFFNRHAILSRISGNEPVSLAYSTRFDNQDYYKDTDYYYLGINEVVTIKLYGAREEMDYIHADISLLNTSMNPTTAEAYITITDEGNQRSYSTPSVNITETLPLSKYLSAYSYGEVDELEITISTTEPMLIKINGITNHARVPFNILLPRILLLFAVLFILWNIRPSSPVYKLKPSVKARKSVVYSVIAVNLLVFLLLMLLNEAFFPAGWTHHQQYHKLAVAITEGHVNIHTGFEGVVSSLDNPYDNIQRNYALQEYAYSVWDMAFYDGNFYVYFGVVPVFLFYLPYYLITGDAFPTAVGILISSFAILVGAFYFMRQLINNYFKKTPFALYIIFSLILGNSIGTVPILLRPDFYSLPIVCALAFTIWGLGIWMSAASLWRTHQATNRQINLRLFIGSLFMALVAGCRPQFLVGSFFVFFILGHCIVLEWKDDKIKLIKRALIAVIPYVVVAVCLMYYNYIRFDSPFDFGANYNLTTNDMTHRGFNLGRIPDGLYAYLFQFPNISLRFPFVMPTEFDSVYMGKTIKETMFGGVFFTHCLLLVLPAYAFIRKELKNKRLSGLCVISMIFALIVVVADTQMAGILNRYYYDFLWLLIIPAIIILLQLYELASSVRMQRSILLFTVTAAVVCLFMDLFIGFQATSLPSYDETLYRTIQAFFTAY